MSQLDEKKVVPIANNPQVDQFVEPISGFATEAIDEEGNKIMAATEQQIEQKNDISVDGNEEVSKIAPFNEFLKERGIDTEKVAEKTKSAEEIRKETTQVVTKKEDQTQQQPVKKAAPLSRNYDDIDEEHRETFKQMSNDAYNTYKPIYLDHKKIKVELEAAKKELGEVKKNPSNLPASYFSHPEAYKLSPEFSSLQVNAEAAQQVANHWAIQAARLRRGEKWQNAPGFDKNGNLIVEEPQDGTAEAEALVAENLQFAQEQLFESRKSLTGFVQGFGSKYKEDVSVIEDAYKKYFPGYDDPKHHTSEMQKKLAELMPASFREGPVAKFLYATIANNAILASKLQAAQKEINKLKGIKEDAANAQPKKGEFVQQTNGVQRRTVKFADYQQERDGGY